MPTKFVVTVTPTSDAVDRGFRAYENVFAERGQAEDYTDLVNAQMPDRWHADPPFEIDAETYDNAKLALEASNLNRPAHLRRRAELLLSIPFEDRTAVTLSANRQVNLAGGRHSDALESAVRSYRDDPIRFRAQRVAEQEADRRTQELERAHINAGTAIGRALSARMDRP